MKRQVTAGIGDAWPVALGMVPLGLAFGLLITQIGFAWYWAPVFSLVIYAGSMEFLAISLIMGGAAPLSAALYGLLVNFRHIFYALNYPMDRVKGWLAKAYGAYALTDETYAIVSARADANWTTARVITIQALLQAGWVGGGVLGALFGSALPFTLVGMEFALTALFTVLMIEAFAANRDLSLPLSAVALGLVAWWIAPENVLMVGMTLYFALLVVRFFVPPVNKALTWRVGARPVGAGAADASGSEEESQ